MHVRAARILVFLLSTCMVRSVTAAKGAQTKGATPRNDAVAAASGVRLKSAA